LFSRIQKNVVITSIVFFSFFFLLPLLISSQGLLRLSLSARDYDNYTRITIESTSPISSSIEQRESFLFVKIRAYQSFRIQRRFFESQMIKSFKWVKGPDYILLSFEMNNADYNHDTFKLSDPDRLVIDIHSYEKEKIESPKPEETPPDQSRPSVTPKSVRTIVLDPGHGGLLSGAKGKLGSLEKDITLDIALILKDIIQKNLAYRVVMTREKDVDVSLENRAATANNNNADIFISIHANSSKRKGASGPETFFLSLNATDEETRRLAYIENNSAEIGDKISSDNDDLIKMILWDLAQAAYLKQSSQLAEDIQNELNSLLGTMNRGIKQGQFKVLTGVACPAVLIEVAFLSNPEEEKKLISPDFQRQVAQAMYRGIIRFLKTYSKK